MPAARRSSQLDARRALDRLRALRSEPARRREFAVELLSGGGNPDLLMTVLDVLAQQPGTDLREALHAKYAALEPAQKKRDPGGFLRAGIIRALQGAAGPQDAPLFERAIATYEPTPADPAGPAVLRAAGLVALTAVDPRSAVLHAVPLLARCSRSSAMTGEPAVSAARVLAALGEETALFLYAETALSQPEAVPAEVLAEALRGLTAVPAQHLLPLLERAPHVDAVVDAALMELVIDHAPEGALTAWLERQLRATHSDELYAFAVTAIVAKRAGHLLRLLAGLAATETAPARLQVLESSLALLGTDPTAAQVLAMVRSKLAGHP